MFSFVISLELDEDELLRELAEDTLLAELELLFEDEIELGEDED